MAKYVIVGSGVAGITAAQMVAAKDRNAEVHVLNKEGYPYYQRPRLWELIAGKIDQEDLYFRSLDWYKSKGIQVHLKTHVKAILPADHRLALSDGSNMDYDRLLLATGANPFIPPISGVGMEGVFVLRSLDDALAIKTYAYQASSVAVIGGGLLGLETAKALMTAGLDATVIEYFPYLLPRQLDREGARVLRSMLEKQGLKIVTGVEPDTITGNGSVNGVLFKDGRRVDCQMILVSTGIRACVDLARDAGLEINRAVIVDNEMRTSAEDIFAAGDLIEHQGVTYGIIPAAIEQAQVAAANLVEPGSFQYDGTLRTTTLKVAGINLTCLGKIPSDDKGYKIIRNRDDVSGNYQYLALKDGKIQCAILLGDTSKAREFKKLMKSGYDVSAYKAHILDVDFDVGELIN